MGRWLKPGFILFVVASMLLTTAGSVFSVEVIYPQDGTYFLRSNYLVIKTGKTLQVDALSIRLNGVDQGSFEITPEVRAVFGDFIILQPEFKIGKNTVRVETYAGENPADSVDAEFYYLENDPSIRPPSKYSQFLMHVPEREDLCAPCHNMNPDMFALQAASPDENPCASCHYSMLSSTYVHGPAGVFACVYCHDKSEGGRKYLVSRGGAALCNECHSDKTEEFLANNYVHGPVGVGLCGLCHDAHASNYPAQLKDGVNVICLGCHDSIKEGEHVGRGLTGAGHPLSGPTDPLSPRSPFSCVSCHDPHGGMDPSLFREGVVGRIALCQMCHRK